MRSKGLPTVHHLATAITVVLLAGCDSGRSSSNGLAHGPLLVGTNVWPGYEPLYLARSLNHFDDDSIRLVECSSSSQVIRAFRNRMLHAAALTLYEALLLKESGQDIRIILIMDISHGADVVLGKPEIQQLRDLKGRTVAVESSALGAYMLARALNHANLTVADVTILPLEVDKHERAFQSGQVDAVVTFDPVRSRLIATGAVPLFDSSQIPGEIVDVFVVHGDALEHNADEINLLLNGWFAAIQYMKEDPNDAGHRMSGRLKLKSSDVLAMYDRLRIPELAENLKLIAGEPPEIAVTARRLAEVMRQEELLDRDVDVTDMFDASALRALEVHGVRAR